METNMGKKVRVAMAAGSLTLAMGMGVYAGAAWARQEYMQAALSNLQDARSNLQSAERNKGGHRLRALHLVNEAIGEVQAGIDAGR
jgi:hypothetical protein